MPLTPAFFSLLGFVWTLIAVESLAAVPSEPSQFYYGQAFYTQLEQDQLHDQELKKALRDIMRSYHIASPGQFDEIHSVCPAKGRCYTHVLNTYYQARKFVWGELHLESNPKSGYFVRTFYCGIDLSDGDFRSGNGIGPGEIPDVEVANTEHLWPQSKFSRRESEDLQRADVHILRPVMAYANNSRSNHPFGEIAISDRPPCPTVNRGYLSKGSRQIYFEPPAHHKGDVARSLFYFSVRYNIAIDEKQEEFLRQWHQEDPVDAWELTRNNEVFDFQRTRNPFVDHPALADLINNF